MNPKIQMIRGLNVESLELVFDLRTEYLDNMLFHDFKLTPDNIISSNFYDNEEERNKEFKDITSFSEFFTIPGTGTITVDKLRLGITLEQFLILLSFDGESGTVEINFSEIELIEDRIFDKEKGLGLLKYFYLFMDVESVKFGYEPAIDDDTCLIELKSGVTPKKDMFNFNLL